LLKVGVLNGFVTFLIATGKPVSWSVAELRKWNIEKATIPSEWKWQVSTVKLSKVRHTYHTRL
jgi:hypothetical protein